MAKPTKSEPRPFLEIAQAVLVDIFTKAKDGGEDLSPDLALLRMWDQLRVVFPPNQREVSASAKRATRRSFKSDLARLKQIHLFAVEQYYRTYFPEESGRGRGRLPEEDRLEAAQMHDRLHSWNEVKNAIESNQPGSAPVVKHGKDKYRKRAAGWK